MAKQSLDDHFFELQSTVCLGKVGLSWIQPPCVPQRRPRCTPEGSSHSGAVRRAKKDLIDIAFDHASGHNQGQLLIAPTGFDVSGTWEATWEKSHGLDPDGGEDPFT